MTSQESRNTPPTTSKRGCLLLMLGALVFAGLLYGLFIYFVSQKPSQTTEANERAAIAQCWQRANDQSLPKSTRTFQESGCKEMEKQFRRKFNQEP